MYTTTFSNNAGNMLKLVTVENDAKFPKQYGSMYCNAYANGK